MVDLDVNGGHPDECGVAGRSLHKLCDRCQLVFGHCPRDLAGVEQETEEGGFACDPKVAGVIGVCMSRSEDENGQLDAPPRQPATRRVNCDRGPSGSGSDGERESLRLDGTKDRRWWAYLGPHDRFRFGRRAEQGGRCRRCEPDVRECSWTVWTTSSTLRSVVEGQDCQCQGSFKRQSDGHNRPRARNSHCLSPLSHSQ
jgi:hypothetical protein